MFWIHEIEDFETVAGFQVSYQIFQLSTEWQNRTTEQAQIWL